MASRKHLLAVNRAIRQAALDEKGLDGPMVELLRDLARKMDAAASDGPPLNLLRAYLSATKDLARAAARRPVVTPAQIEPEGDVGAVSPPDLKLVEESPLDKVRRNKRAG